MDIQHSTHRLLFEAKQRNTPFYNLYQADEDLIMQLVSLINSLFQPLTWILQETLYKRIKKEDKGWIDINFLNRNKRLKKIFKKYQIPPQCRRRRNFMKKAIQKSIVKRKGNLIKRREHLNINQEAKKVLYFEHREQQLQRRVCQNQQSKSEVFYKMSQKHLKEMIRDSLKKIFGSKLQMLNPNTMQMENLQLQKNVEDLEKTFSEVVFTGCLSKVQQQQSSKTGDQIQNSQKQNKHQEVNYRWCFVYLPFLDQQIVAQIYQDVEKSLNACRDPQRIQLEDKMSSLNISQCLNQSNQLIQKQSIKVLTLTQMIQIHFPIYKQVCEKIGYHHVDQRQLKLKLRKKKKQIQKTRLLQSRYLDDKVDLVNNFHIKMQIQKEKRAYWEKKNREIQQKIRRRQQRRRNRINKSYEEQKAKTFTQKLKYLLEIDNSKNQQPQIQQPSYRINGVQIQSQHSLQKNMASKDIEDKQPTIKIKFPKYEQDQNCSQKSKEIQKTQPKINNSNIDLVYEQDQNDQEQEFQSSGEEFLLNKKKKKSNNQTKKIGKKIGKKSQKQKKTNKTSQNYEILNKSEPYSKHKKSNKDRQPIKNQSNSNSSYNLRHKNPAQGTYLKMVGYFCEESGLGNSQRKNDKKFEEDQQSQHNYTGRSLRNNKKKDGFLN